MKISETIYAPFQTGKVFTYSDISEFFSRLKIAEMSSITEETKSSL